MVIVGVEINLLKNEEREKSRCPKLPKIAIKQPHMKMDSQEEDLTYNLKGRQSYRKRNAQENNITRSQPHRKRNAQENILTGREDYKKTITGRWP